MYLAPPQGVIPSEFREMFVADKIRIIGLLYGEKTMTIIAVLIYYRNVTD